METKYYEYSLYDDNVPIKNIVLFKSKNNALASLVYLIFQKLFQDETCDFERLIY